MQVSAFWIWAILAAVGTASAHTVDTGCTGDYTLLADRRFVAWQSMSMTVIADHELPDLATSSSVAELEP